MTAAGAAAAPGGLDRWTTTREISQQPAVWRAHGPSIAAAAHDIRTWLAGRPHDEVWFCGAGTSAFIGETLAARLNCAPGPARYRAVPTTDLVSCPQNYLRPGVKLLVVLFGRSGNSSETIGALDLLAAHAPEADRLHITCNGDSALARSTRPGLGDLRTIVLPPETDDRGFAMTSSYTTMLLAGTCLLRSGAAGAGGRAFQQAGRRGGGDHQPGLSRAGDRRRARTRGVSGLGPADRLGSRVRPQGARVDCRHGHYLLGFDAWLSPRAKGGDERQDEGVRAALRRPSHADL